MPAPDETSREALRVLLRSRLTASVVGRFTQAQLDYLIQEDLDSEEMLAKTLHSSFPSPPFTEGTRRMLVDTYGSGGGASSSGAGKTVIIVEEDFEGKADGRELVFQNNTALQEYLNRNQVGGLLHYTPEALEAAEKTGTKPKAKRLNDFEQLQEGQVYSVGSGSRGVLRAVRQELTHLGQRREDEPSHQMLRTLRKAYPKEALVDLRNALCDAQGNAREMDALILGPHTAWFGEHKAFVDSPSVVNEVAKHRDQLQELAKDPSSGSPLAGRRVHCAFMAEKVALGAEKVVQQTCERLKVLRFGSNGRAVSVIGALTAATCTRGFAFTARLMGRF